jgi:hypothetical protein
MWGVQELEYLGHKISVAGVLPLPSHVAAIQDFPRPTIIKELQAFLGMVNSTGGSCPASPARCGC